MPMTLVDEFCCTRPIEPLLICVCRLLMLVAVLLSAVFTAENALPTLL